MQAQRPLALVSDSLVLRFGCASQQCYVRTGEQHNPVLMTPQHLNHTVILQQEKQASRLGAATFDPA